MDLGDMSELPSAPRAAVANGNLPALRATCRKTGVGSERSRDYLTRTRIEIAGTVCSGST
jgi:hypothetical protein